ncbi:ornithine cyclodeaminase family protein [Tindallia californiensis]|uniref:Ornithine cyclodeaminase n=1 Tax=Tindallia californiensis TaxID=159292 RepID=A0A1H3LML0_9FIRM|nr:ornithine cyclodeaminase family protein [Tindallia californiensis]SDY65194.1 ornithine cyclodeaminase [Tindallia californiensis]
MKIINAAAMKQSVNDQEMIDAIEEAFHLYSLENFTMPERLAVKHQEDTMLYMPCLTPDSIGTKMLSLMPQNPSKGKPLIDGMMILNNREDGTPLAIMNGQLLTAMRTGAVGGHAVRHLAYPESQHLGLIGCGVQGLYQVKYACAERSIATVYLYDEFKEDLTDFVESIRQETDSPSLHCVVCNSATEVAQNSDILITATSSKEPVLPNDPELFSNKCVVSIGSWRPDMREIPEAIWQTTSKVYTELPYACEETGDLSQPLADDVIALDQVHLMSDFLKAIKSGKKTDLQSTRFYKSVGMSLFDLVVATNIYEKAKEKGLGTDVDW